MQAEKQHQNDLRHYERRYKKLATDVQQTLRSSQNLKKGLNGLLEREQIMREALEKFDREVVDVEGDLIRLGGSARIAELKPIIERKKELYDTLEYLKKVGDVIRNEATGG